LRRSTTPTYNVLVSPSPAPCAHPSAHKNAIRKETERRLLLMFRQAFERRSPTSKK
jgi:hypothetical protein